MRRLALLVVAIALFALPWTALAQSVEVDVVVLVDTSASVIDDVDRLCVDLPDALSGGPTVRWRVVGIVDPYACAKDTAQSLISNSLVADDEDWGIAVAELASGYAWQPGATRLIIPLSDAGPASGDPVDDPGPDRDAATRAIRAAVAHKVILSPLVAARDAGASAEDRSRLEALAQDMASKTGGRVFLSTGSSDVADAVKQLILSSVESKAGLTAIAAAIPTPGNLSLDGAYLLTNIALAALAAAVLGLTATLARESFGAKRSLPSNRVTDAIGLLGQRAAAAFSVAVTPTAWRIGNLRLRRALTIVILAAFLALTALVAAFLDPNFQPNTPIGVGTFVTLIVALAVVNAAAAVGGTLAARSQSVAPGLRVRPGAVLLVIVCVAMSRSLGFLPGYLIGLPAGLALIAVEANRDRDAAIGRAALFAAIIVGALAWLVSWPLEGLSASLSASVGSGVASLALSLVGGIQSALLTIFFIALEFALFDLLPIGSTTGRRWFEQRRLVWGVAFGVVAFAALHTIFNPNRAGLEALRNPSLLPLGAMIATYSGVTLIAWLLTNEARLREPGNLNRRSALMAGALIAVWLGGIACVALAEIASTFNVGVVLIAGIALVLAGVGVWMWMKRRTRATPPPGA